MTALQLPAQPAEMGHRICCLYTSDSFRSRKFYPFAFLGSDFARQTARLAAIERALDQPGEQGIRALLALKRDSELDRSSLEPREGLLPLIDSEMGHYLTVGGSSAGRAAHPGGRGPGTDTIPLASIVGPAGQVTGVDYDPAMVTEAQARASEAGASSWVRHKQADASFLPFATGTFDACRSERLFQHVGQPAQVLGEMLRVTKSSGWIVVVDTDWSSFSVDSVDMGIERRLAGVLAQRVLQNGCAGRQLFRLFRQQQIQDISVETVTHITVHQSYRDGKVRWRRCQVGGDRALYYFDYRNRGMKQKERARGTCTVWLECTGDRCARERRSTDRYAGA